MKNPDREWIEKIISPRTRQEKKLTPNQKSLIMV
jgi:hypothetical protein